MNVEDAEAIAQEFFDGWDKMMSQQMVPNPDKVARLLAKKFKEFNRAYKESQND